MPLISTLKYAAILAWSSFVLTPLMWALTTSFKTANGVTSGPTYLPWAGYEPSLDGWRSLLAPPRHRYRQSLPQQHGRHQQCQPHLDHTRNTRRLRIVALHLPRRLCSECRHCLLFHIAAHYAADSARHTLFLMLQFLGLLDTRIGLVIVYIALLLPIAVWIMVDFFDGVPRQIDEMAMLDGCTPFEAFWRVVLPNSLSGVLVAAMFCLIFGWNDFFFAFTLTFTDTQLLPVAVVSLNSSVTPWWSLSASALVSVAPLIVIAVVVERLLSRGTLAGAIR